MGKNAANTHFKPTHGNKMVFENCVFASEFLLYEDAMMCAPWHTGYHRAQRWSQSVPFLCLLVTQSFSAEVYGIVCKMCTSHHPEEPGESLLFTNKIINCVNTN